MSSGMTWDLTSFFPTFNGVEMREFKQAVQRSVDELQRTVTELSPLAQHNQDAWEKAFLTSEELLCRVSHLFSYIGCLTAAHSENEDYRAAEASLAVLNAELEKIEVGLMAGLKAVSDQDFALFQARPALADAAHHLRQMREEAAKTMAQPLEVLAADLGIDGISAWGRLYDTISGNLSFTMNYPDGKSEVLPMAQRRALQGDGNRAVRKAAFDGGNVIWEQYAEVMAGAINHIAGTRLVLNRYRGIEHFLDVALRQSRVSRPTLDALFAAIHENRDFIQRLGRAKAKALGLQQLAWYDIEAALPLPATDKMTWKEGTMQVQKAFDGSYPELGTFLSSCLEQRWVESEKRAWKRPGAFCTGSLLTRESRVFMTYTGTVSDNETLAHEIGHAFHSYVLRDKRPFARLYPMPLAESASIFGECIFADGVLNDPNSSQEAKAEILNSVVGQGIGFLIDIPVRFSFEKAFHEERIHGEVSVSRLKELMSKAQQDIMGELLEPGGEDPLFWASKLHFYITGVTFYNFPYTFGFLLSRGLFNLFKERGSSFLENYRNFLAISGSHTAEEVAKRAIGVDLTQPDFWSASIRSMERELAMFEEIVPKVLKTG